MNITERLRKAVQSRTERLRKATQSGAERLSQVTEPVRDFVRYEIPFFVRDNWLPLAVLVVLVGVFLAWHLEFRDSWSTESTRWTLSAMVQAIAALAGLLLVGLTLLWTRASNARSHLRLVRRRYLDLLRGEAPGDTAIEHIRRDYMQGLKRRRRDLQEDPYPWKHETYPTHKEVGRGLALLSMLVSDIYNVDPASAESERLSRDLVWLGYDEDEIYTLYGDLFAARSDPAEAVELVTDLINVGSNFIYVLSDPPASTKSCSDIAGEVWGWSQDDDLDGSLEAIRSFARMSGLQAKVALVLMAATIAVGLFTVLSTGDDVALWPVSLSLALALASLQGVILLLNSMLRA